MAATTEQKVDFLLKKIGYVASKTGIAEDESSLSGTKKAPFAESIPSPLVTPSTSIWADASLIPSTPPGSDTSYVKVYLTGTSGVRMTVDNTVSGNRTFLARSTYGNDSSAILGDWIDTSFSADYIIKVFKGDPNSGGVQLSAAGAGSNDTWFFDYSSGVLNFNGTQIPSGVTSSNIYIVGYRYIGAKGGRPAAGIATFASLDVSGISTFRDDVNFISANGNNILFDKSDNALEFGDNVKANFGDSADLQIYHTGSVGYIKNFTGDLRIDQAQTSSQASLNSNILKLRNSACTENYLTAYNNAQVELFYDNTKRFETTSTGAQVTGNLNVTGVLTYDDVTNIDSLGIVTARTGVDVNAGGINVDGGGLNIVGVSTFANDIIANGSIDLAGDIDVDGHTNLDNVNIAGIATVGSNLVFGSSGDSDINHKSSSNALRLRHNTQTKLAITANYSTFANTIVGNSNLNIDGQTDLDVLNVAELATFSANIDANGDLDVDGHTELDNVNISGLTTAALLNVSSLTDGRVTFASASGRLVDSANLTFDGTNLIAASAKITDLTSGRVVTAGTNGALQDSNNLTFNGSLLDVTGNLSVSGNVSIAGTLTYQDVTNVDSVGIATARVGIKVLAGGIEIDGGGIDVQAGVSTFAGNVLIPSNNLGIGVASPSNRIDVAGSGNQQIQLVRSDGGNGFIFKAGSSHSTIFTAGGQHYFKIATNNVDRLQINSTGITTFTGKIFANNDLDVDGQTDLDNVSIAGITTTTDSINIITDNKKLNLGASQDFRIYHDGTYNKIDNAGTTDLFITVNNYGEYAAKFKANNSVDLFYDGTKRFETTSIGVDITGTTTDDGARHDGDVYFIGGTSGRNVVWDMSADSLEFADNAKLAIGSGTDLLIYHDGSNSLIRSGGTGQLQIESSNNTSIVMGNAGLTETIFKGSVNGSVDLYYNNTVRLQTSGIGVTVTGETKTTTLNVTGITTTNNLNVTGTATIASIGSTVGVSSNFYFGDNDKIFFGDGDDLFMYHSGTHSFIDNSQGQLYIRGGSQVISIQATNVTHSIRCAPNAEVKLYFAGSEKLATTVGGINVTGTTDTDNLVNAGVSTFVGIITASAVGNVIPFLFNNYSDLPAASSYHGAFAHVHTVAKGFFAHAGNWVEIVSKETDGRVGTGTETYNIKDLNIVGVATVNQLKLADSKYLQLGNNADLQLYHDGSHSYIQDTGTGNLYFTSNNFNFFSPTSEKFAVFNNNSSVELYFDNAKKIETKIYGVEITGTTDMDGLVVSGVSTFAGGSFSGNISAVDGTFSGNVSIAGTLTYQDVTNIDSVGIVTARTDLHVGTGATVIKTVSGQVGINSTIPAHMLDVGGVINSSTDVRVNNESLVTQNQALNDAVAMAIALG